MQNVTFSVFNAVKIMTQLTDFDTSANGHQGLRSSFQRTHSFRELEILDKLMQGHLYPFLRRWLFLLGSSCSLANHCPHITQAFSSLCAPSPFGVKVNGGLPYPSCFCASFMLPCMLETCGFSKSFRIATWMHPKLLVQMLRAIS